MYILSLLTVTYTIFLSLIFDVFKTLLVLKPNLKEVTDAISPFDFVFRFSTVENFIKVKNNKIFTIGNICIETINCTPNTVGVRTVNVESDFKNIFFISLTGYITEGQTAEHLMRQVVHDYYSKIVATKQVKLYASGNQSLELTIVGTI